MSYLHGRTHGIEEVDNDEGEDGEPLFPRETRHGCVLSPDGLKTLQMLQMLHILIRCFIYVKHGCVLSPDGLKTCSLQMLHIFVRWFDINVKRV